MLNLPNLNPNISCLTCLTSTLLSVPCTALPPVTVSMCTHQDFTSDRLPLDRVAAVLGEFGVKDHGSDEVADMHGDSTHIAKVDAKFLADLSAYTRRIQAESGNPVSWFFWSWNANSRECFLLCCTHS